MPEEISVVGMDNSVLAVDAMSTPISSVDQNFTTLGYRGAELLNRLMQGKASARQAHLHSADRPDCAAKAVICFSSNHSGLARCLRYLWSNFHKPIGVDDLGRVAAMSRSGLHRAFTEKIGRSAGC